MKQFGLAKAYFLNKYQRSPWNYVPPCTPFIVHEWPLIEEQLREKRISYLDYLLAQRLLRDALLDSHESVALFLCYIIMASKAGHLCVEITDTQLTPSISQLWTNENNQDLNEEEAETLLQTILKGSQLVPSFLVTQVTSLDCTSFPSTPLCQCHQHFYLQKHWIFESLFLDHFNQHIREKPTVEIDEEQVQVDVEKMLVSGEINAEQAQSILEACMHSVTLITGGPGTGKSYTAGKLINVLYKNRQCKDTNFQIVLAAPTGKAAANLQKSLQKTTLSQLPPIQAKTLHSLLNIQRSQLQNSSSGLNADLVVVDECSMIDILMMSKLFESLKKGCRVILLGDPQQLPAVGAGSIFMDLNQLCLAHLPLSHIHLKTCLRAELKSIIDFAELVKNGLADQAIAVLNDSTIGVSKLKLSGVQNHAQKEIVSHLASLFPSFVDNPKDALQLFNSFNRMRLLSPLRKGPFGVEVLNQLIWKVISQKSTKSSWIAIPIMISANDYQQELYNGDTGILLRKLPLNRSENEDYALFASRTNSEELRRFSIFLLPKYELAYCLSVHKSQGSEFDHVILVLPEGSEIFGREVFYTGITRARKQVEIWGTDATLKKTILTQEQRLSNFAGRYAKIWNHS